MRAKLVEDGAQKTWVLVFEVGDEVVATLQRFARDERLGASRFTAIGGFRNAIVGYFEWDAKRYRPIPVLTQAEVLSAMGDVTLGPDGPQVHAHVVLGLADGSTVGGHLLEGHVRPTLELVVTESPAHLVRRRDPTTGLALIDLDAPAAPARARRSRSGGRTQRPARPQPSSDGQGAGRADE